MSNNLKTFSLSEYLRTDIKNIYIYISKSAVLAIKTEQRMEELDILILEKRMH